ncbi:hypothetical protein M0811_00086 [Anaeramoeba ignava]|uniref:Uncharacterized protein n=1 Tax=Anaeramoeba ignava TaxID=1746090 RepID=A0A9Q0RFI2_ANAIG|nr:hypothetical protein M0811_00086 [Anaeramoeba ignava]
MTTEIPTQQIKEPLLNSTKLIQNQDLKDLTENKIYFNKSYQQKLKIEANLLSKAHDFICPATITIQNDDIEITFLEKTFEFKRENSSILLSSKNQKIIKFISPNKTYEFIFSIENIQDIISIIESFELKNPLENLEQNQVENNVALNVKLYDKKIGISQDAILVISPEDITIKAEDKIYSDKIKSSFRIQVNSKQQDVLSFIFSKKGPKFVCSNPKIIYISFLSTQDKILFLNQYQHFRASFDKTTKNTRIKLSKKSQVQNSEVEYAAQTDSEKPLMLKFYDISFLDRSLKKIRKGIVEMTGNNIKITNEYEIVDHFPISCASLKVHPKNQTVLKIEIKKSHSKSICAKQTYLIQFGSFKHAKNFIRDYKDWLSNQKLPEVK